MKDFGRNRLKNKSGFQENGMENVTGSQDNRKYCSIYGHMNKCLGISENTFENVAKL